jgi:5,5'-dehydrodivanillate O-demethylase
MLSPEQNKLLTQTAAGTPMGELLRRYWWPIAGVSEFDEAPTKPVRLMGEDLALYKDRSGNYGLLDRHCPHRRADLTYGLIEDCGIRCSYHGWHFDAAGHCLAQPYDDIAHPEANLKAQVRVKAYPVEECGGLLWAYLGPQPAPCLPRWEFFAWKNGFRQIVLSELECNWLQC